MSCGVGHRRGLDPVLLWLWRKLAAIVPIRPLAWELPCAVGVALKRQKDKKKKKIKGSMLDVLNFVYLFLKCKRFLKFQN